MSAHSQNLLSRLIFRAANNADPDSLASRYRRKRIDRFLLLAKTAGARRILDVGGTPNAWASAYAEIPSGFALTLLNLDFSGQCNLPGVNCVVGDGRRMNMFENQQFDFCICNSVIEHFSSLSNQEDLATEIRRVSKAYFVQTPNYYFPLEPHFLVPFWQFAPLAVRAKLIARRSFGWMPKTSNEKARAVVESIRLLSERELRALFPGCRIERERFGPLSKSLIAIGGVR